MSKCHILYLVVSLFFITCVVTRDDIRSPVHAAEELRSPADYPKDAASYRTGAAEASRDEAEPIIPLPEKIPFRPKPQVAANIYHDKKALTDAHGEEAEFWGVVADPECNNRVHVYGNLYHLCHKQALKILEEKLQAAKDKFVCPELHLMLKAIKGQLVLKDDSPRAQKKKAATQTEEMMAGSAEPVDPGKMMGTV